jgi:hypothetical protein
MLFDPTLSDPTGRVGDVVIVATPDESTVPDPNAAEVVESTNVTVPAFTVPQLVPLQVTVAVNVTGEP